MPPIVALTETAPGAGSAGYVTAAVLVSAALVLLYLVIVAMRVRDSARRLERLEARLDGATGSAAAQGDGVGREPTGPVVGDPAAVAAAAEALGAKR